MKALRLHRELTAIWATGPGWRGYLRSVNHSDLGKRFIVAAFAFFAIGGVLAMLIRAQLATPRSAFVGPDIYNQLFTMHGSIMMFLFAIPMFEGLAMYLLPKMLGARDLAFPRLSALGWWCYLFGGIIIVASLLAGVAPNAGWFLYPPLSGKPWTPGINSDVWLLGITFVEISALSAAIEITVSILKLRAPGMTLDRLPLFAWYLLATAGMMIFAFPPLILGSIMLELERAFGWPFFMPDNGGSPLLWQHLFWLFGHPEVYIIFLPAAGAISTILPVMARTPILAYRAIVAAVMALAFLSFGLWVHHMFTTGIPHMALGFFSAASTLVAVPTAVQVFAWLGTLWAGRPQMKLPMLYLIGFFVVFVIGGLTGVMLAVVPFNAQAHDTAFVTAHLHYVLVGGFVFPMLAAAYYWLPHFSGRQRVMRLGEAAFWLIFIGFNLTFFMMHLTGLLGMPRRIDTYPGGLGWSALNLLSSVGAFVQAFGFALFALDVGLQLRLGRRHRRNPWRAGTLEWAMMTPAPAYNFASLPTVGARDPLHDDPGLTLALARGEGLLHEPYDHRRETLAVDMVDATPHYVVVLPGNSWLPITTAAMLAGFFLAMLAGWYVSAPFFLVGVAVLGWHWRLIVPGAAGTAQSIGGGMALPVGSADGDSTGWWGSVLILIASATLFISLIFGCAFLFIEPRSAAAVAPRVSLIEVTAIAALAGTAALATRRRRGRLAIAAQMGMALLLALIAWSRLSSPSDHALIAAAALMIGYAALHSVLAALIAASLRADADTARRRIAILWSDYGAAVATFAVLSLASWTWLV